MKHNIVLSLFFFTVCLAVCNSVHALKIAVFSKDSIIAKEQSLLKIEGKIKGYAQKKQYDSAIIYTKKMLSLSKIKGDSTSMAKAHFRLGFYHKKIDNNVVAFQHYNRSYQIHNNLGDSISAASRLSSMANIQKRFGDFSGCRITALDALALNGNTSNFERLLSIYHIIAISLKEEKNFQESLKWNNRSMELINEHKPKINSKSIIVHKNSRANIFAELKQYDSSINILQDLLKDTLVGADSVEYSRVLANLGRIKWMQNPRNTESEELLLEALEIRERINSISGLISSNVHLSKFYQDKDSIRSLKHAIDALNNAKKFNSLTSILETLDLIIPLKKRLQLELGEEAELYSSTQNKLRENQQRVRAIYATTKYDNDQLTKENLLLQATSANKEKQRVLFLSGFIIALLLAGFLVYYKNQQRKRDSIIASHKTEARISKKIHDELANDVSGIMNFVETQIDVQSKKKNELLTFLNSIYLRARDISTQIADIHLEDFPKTIKNLIAQHQTLSNTVVINSIESIDWEHLEEHRKIAVYRSIQELLVNSQKHAKATRTTIAFKNNGRKREIIYTDNGIGFNPKDQILSGLTNVETRISKIGGTFSFDSQEGKGFKAKLLF